MMAATRGALLCNCIPHLARGLAGQPFPTPFGKPRGIGESSPLVDTLWGFFNLLVGVALLAGALLLGIHLSLHFGRHRGGR